MKKQLISLTLASILSATSYAQTVRYVDYDEDKVINITTAEGIVSEIVFAEDEEIEHFSFGFMDAWSAQIAKPNVLVFKPVAEHPETNILVQTNLRSYMFTLTSGNNKWRGNPAKSKATYSTRLRYPEEGGFGKGSNSNAAFKTSKEPILKYKKYDYRATSKAQKNLMIPVRMGDDGVFTYMKFPVGASRFPIFERIDGKDSIINFNQRPDGWIVLHGVYDRLVIRFNDQAVEMRRNHSLKNEASSDNRIIKKTAPKKEEKAEANDSLLKKSVGGSNE